MCLRKKKKKKKKRQDRFIQRKKSSLYLHYINQKPLSNLNKQFKRHYGTFKNFKKDRKQVNKGDCAATSILVRLVHYKSGTH